MTLPLSTAFSWLENKCESVSFYGSLPPFPPPKKIIAFPFSSERPPLIVRAYRLIVTPSCSRWNEDHCPLLFLLPPMINGYYTTFSFWDEPMFLPPSSEIIVLSGNEICIPSFEDFPLFPPPIIRAFPPLRRKSRSPP